MVRTKKKNVKRSRSRMTNQGRQTYRRRSPMRRSPMRRSPMRRSPMRRSPMRRSPMRGGAGDSMDDIPNFDMKVHKRALGNHYELKVIDGEFYYVLNGDPDHPIVALEDGDAFYKTLQEIDMDVSEEEASLKNAMVHQKEKPVGLIMETKRVASASAPASAPASASGAGAGAGASPTAAGTAKPAPAPAPAGTGAPIRHLTDINGKKYIETDAGGDGDCFFHSVAASAGGDQTGHDLRKLMIDWIRKNKDTIVNQKESDDGKGPGALTSAKWTGPVAGDGTPIVGPNGKLQCNACGKDHLTTKCPDFKGNAPTAHSGSQLIISGIDRGGTETNIDKDIILENASVPERLVFLETYCDYMGRQGIWVQGTFELWAMAEALAEHYKKQVKIIPFSGENASLHIVRSGTTSGDFDGYVGGKGKFSGEMEILVINLGQNHYRSLKADDGSLSPSPAAKKPAKKPAAAKPVIGVSLPTIRIAHGDIINYGSGLDGNVAIVNAASNGGAGGGGVDGAITAAGGNGAFKSERLQAVKNNNGRIQTGSAIIQGPKPTTGYGTLQCTHVIHAVGPDYASDQDGADQANKDDQLKAAYKKAIELAKGAGVRYVGFSLISADIFRGIGTPQERDLNTLLQISVNAVIEELKENPPTGPMTVDFISLVNGQTRTSLAATLNSAQGTSGVNIELKPYIIPPPTGGAVVAHPAAATAGAAAGPPVESGEMRKFVLIVTPSDLVKASKALRVQASSLLELKGILAEKLNVTLPAEGAADVSMLEPGRKEPTFIHSLDDLPLKARVQLWSAGTDPSPPLAAAGLPLGPAPPPILFYRKPAQGEGGVNYEFTNFYTHPSKPYLFRGDRYGGDPGAPTTRDSAVWKTPEHYFQVYKFLHVRGQQPTNLVQQIYDQAKDLPTGNDGENRMGPDWATAVQTGTLTGTPVPVNRQYWHGSTKIEILKGITAGKLRAMYNAVKMKFTQDADLKTKLEETGNAILIENAGHNDPTWGDGKYGDTAAGTSSWDFTKIDDKEGMNKLGLLLMEIRDELTGKQTCPVHARIEKDTTYNEQTGYFNLEWSPVGGWPLPPPPQS
jgi:O-acetyl-ADP-ribose deacetylase (regulator of RNase III)/predicted NAD-dependent protein-ADP-ribosyltransferase YbiA (DUF1768 family)